MAQTAAEIAKMNSTKEFPFAEYGSVGEPTKDTDRDSQFLTLADLAGGVVGKVTLTQPANGATITIADGKTFTVNNTVTIVGTDGRTYTLPTVDATLARSSGANTFTGKQSISAIAEVLNMTASTGTSTIYETINNTGGNTYLGISNSAGGGLLGGVTAYATCLLTESATDLVLGTNNARRLVLAGAGGSSFIGACSASTTLSAGTGAAVGGATAGAGGLAFPATAVAVANANTLDDYEEGTFTPTLTLGAGSVTYTTQTGSYTKIGRLVTVLVNIVVDVATTPSGTLRITGLPFTSSANGKGAVSLYANGLAATAITQIMGNVEASATTTLLARYAAGSVADMGGDTANSCFIQMQASYEV